MEEHNNSTPSSGTYIKHHEIQSSMIMMRNGIPRQKPVIEHKAHDKKPANGGNGSNNNNNNNNDNNTNTNNTSNSNKDNNNNNNNNDNSTNTNNNKDNNNNNTNNNSNDAPNSSNSGSSPPSEAIASTPTNKKNNNNNSPHIPEHLLEMLKSSPSAALVLNPNSSNNRHRQHTTPTPPKPRSIYRSSSFSPYNKDRANIINNNNHSKPFMPTENRMFSEFEELLLESTRNNHQKQQQQQRNSITPTRSTTTRVWFADGSHVDSPSRLSEHAVITPEQRQRPHFDIEKLGDDMERLKHHLELKLQFELLCNNNDDSSPPSRPTNTNRSPLRRPSSCPPRNVSRLTELLLEDAKQPGYVTMVRSDRKESYEKLLLEHVIQKHKQQQQQQQRTLSPARDKAREKEKVTSPRASESPSRRGVDKSSNNNNNNNDKSELSPRHSKKCLSDLDRPLEQYSFSPQIDPHSKEMTKQLAAISDAARYKDIYKKFLLNHGEKAKLAQKQEEEMMKKMGKPSINAVSKRLARSVDDLQHWNALKSQKLQKAIDDKKDQTNQICTFRPIVSERSRKLAERHRQKTVLAVASSNNNNNNNNNSSSSSISISKYSFAGSSLPVSPRSSFDGVIDSSIKHLANKSAKIQQYYFEEQRRTPQITEKARALSPRQSPIGDRLYYLGMIQEEKKRIERSKDLNRHFFGKQHELQLQKQKRILQQQYPPERQRPAESHHHQQLTPRQLLLQQTFESTLRSSPRSPQQPSSPSTPPRRRAEPRANFLQRERELEELHHEFEEEIAKYFADFYYNDNDKEDDDNGSHYDPRRRSRSIDPQG